MTETSGCRKAQQNQELLANPCSNEDCVQLADHVDVCSDEDCVRLAEHLETCRECREEIDLTARQMSGVVKALSAGFRDDTSIEPAFRAAMEQLLAYDLATATLAERTETLRALPSPMEWKRSLQTTDGARCNVNARTILVVCVALLASVIGANPDYAWQL